jgi:phage tail protein X
MRTKKKTYAVTGQTFGQGIILEIKKRNNGLASVGNSLWKGLGSKLS